MNEVFEKHFTTVVTNELNSLIRTDRFKLPEKWFCLRRGSFFESMRTLQAIENVNDILAILNEGHVKLGCEPWFKSENTTIRPYAFDKRLGCEVNAVFACGRIIGFTNAEG